MGCRVFQPHVSPTFALSQAFPPRPTAWAIAMKIVGHTDYQTTANIYTHVRDEMLKKATVNMNEVFQNRTGKE